MKKLIVVLMFIITLSMITACTKRDPESMKADVLDSINQIEDHNQLAISETIELYMDDAVANTQTSHKTFEYQKEPYYLYVYETNVRFHDQ